ncbi:MAG: CPBP family intramembrane metalloprotease [Planctomycetes bacterium]|nr:CPBP family intramembrane metalloprotease [Planctomycetota bacterium]
MASYIIHSMIAAAKSFAFATPRDWRISSPFMSGTLPPIEPDGTAAPIDDVLRLTPTVESELEPVDASRSWHVVVVTVTAVAIGYLLTKASMAHWAPPIVQHVVYAPSGTKPLAIYYDYKTHGLGLLAPAALPMQFTMFVAAILAAWRLPRPRQLTSALGFVPGRLSAATWPLWIMGTLFVSLLMVIARMSMGSEDPVERLLGLSLQESAGMEVVGIFLIASLIPGMCEELLFRGLATRWLACRMSAPAAIALSAILFACAHLNPSKIPFVIPIGLWLGYTTLATQSIYPSMIGHFCNNAIALYIVSFTQQNLQIARSPKVIAVMLAVYSIGFVGSIYVHRRALHVQSMARLNSITRGAPGMVESAGVSGTPSSMEKTS